MTQEERILTLDCLSENSRNDLKGHDRRMSSAYRMIDEIEEKGTWNMSFTYKMKRSGPKIKP